VYVQLKHKARYQYHIFNVMIIKV